MKPASLIESELGSSSGLSDSVSSPSVLRIANLSQQFGALTVLQDIHFSMCSGEWVALMGPSGSGKTTLLNILACLSAPSRGTYFLDGFDTASLTDQQRAVVRREKIGLIFQQFHLIPYLTALENIMLAQHYHSVCDAQEAEKMLQRVGLGQRIHHRPSQLSGGEQQRVCIARALINDPALLLADEPTGNLDEANETNILGLLRELHQEGKTILLVTHNPELAHYAQRIIYLHHGRIERESQPSSVPSL
ncbi:ABC transporter ATP-binding protein [Deltaproteobacteria bacterium TL4]